MKNMIIVLVLLVSTWGYSQSVPSASIVYLRMQDGSAFCVLLNNEPAGDFDFNHALWIRRPGVQNIKIFRKSYYYGYENRQLVWEQNIRVAGNREIYARLCPVNGIQIEQQFVRQDNRPAAVVPTVACHYPMPVAVSSPNAYVPVAMTEPNYLQLIEQLQSAGFESTRMGLLSQALSFNYISVQQLMGILQTFYFEQTRLEVAKMAYPRVTDPQHFYQLSGSFTFSSSMENLQRQLRLL